jgi:tRNA A37 threonylcarbamoyladenosine biosynthesis protein TsaE
LQEKHLLEEEERKDAAKSQKVLAESSLKLADWLQKMSERPSPDTILIAVNEKSKQWRRKLVKLSTKSSLRF